MKSLRTKLAAVAVVVAAAAIGVRLFEQSTSTVNTVDDLMVADANSKTACVLKVPVANDIVYPKLVRLNIELPQAVFVSHRSANFRDLIPNLEPWPTKPRQPFLAPVGTKNVALGKPVSASDQEPIIGRLEMITDDDKEAADRSYVELSEPGLQHITIDLQCKCNIFVIAVWHYHRQPRAYFDVIVQVADDPDFCKNVRTLFNNDHDNSAGFGAGEDRNYVETYKGKLIDAKGARGRYVRLYSSGNDINEFNHYIEVEVYGKPIK